MCHPATLSNVKRLLHLLLVMFVANGVMLAQDSELVKVNEVGNTVKVFITEPRVRQDVSEYRNIILREGDVVTVSAGGCVQTGGSGKTWKRYVNPSGPNSNRLYHGVISLPYLTGSFPESPTVKGFVRMSDLLGREYRVPSLKDDNPAPFYLRLGYEDDGYDDNGYWGRQNALGMDNGTEDQCVLMDNAAVFLTIKHAVPLSFEADIDRPGLDYRSFDLRWARPELCRDTCAGESQCKAYTYVKPGFQGAGARCWLKSSVPATAANECCISGVK